MARKIILSTMSHSAEGFASLQKDLAGLQMDRGLEISFQEFDYATGWSDFMRMSIYGGNPDASEIGTTWINDFAAMNILRPFAATDVRMMGGVDAFVPGVWRSGTAAGVIWAIPWLTDLSLVCYRRDLLAKAGVNETGAFASPAQFEQTLRQLQEAGLESPWVVPTQRSYINVHNLAMWVWQAGEDLVDTHNKLVLLDRPVVREAILSFLKLYRFLAPGLRHLSEREADAAFVSGRAAMAICGPWTITSAVQQKNEVAANLGLAVPFGSAYTGGSSLIVWQKTAQAQAALEIIQHLTSQEFQTVFPQSIGLLPARLASLESFPLPDASLYPVVLDGLKSGRSLPNLGLWGLIEDRLSNAIPNFWNDILSCENPDLEALYDKHIIPLSNRLNITMSQS